jgi:tRNA threonylcarbamoyl adenosine modification protein (Sua5/YciO/YrdC/YwlC family)
VVDILREGGLGVIPTDTCYMFVTPVDSRQGVERIYTIKEVESYKRKPLTLLCKDISQISTYTTATNFKSTFKMLKALLPGPYTFIFPATNDLPRMILEHKNRSAKTWKRRQIGVRIPSDDICREIMEELGKPLLCAGAPSPPACLLGMLELPFIRCVKPGKRARGRFQLHSFQPPSLLTLPVAQGCRETTNRTAPPQGLKTCMESSSTSLWMPARDSKCSAPLSIGRSTSRAFCVKAPDHWSS